MALIDTATHIILREVRGELRELLKLQQEANDLHRATNEHMAYQSKILFEMATQQNNT